MDPSYALQVALVATLKADQGMQAIVFDRVFDRVPSQPVGEVEVGWPFPYVTIGTTQPVPEHGHGYEGTETHFTIDAWSRAPGFPQVKQLGAAVAAALHGAQLDLNGHRSIEVVWEAAHYLRDPDGLTNHGVIMFKALTDLT